MKFANLYRMFALVVAGALVVACTTQETTEQAELESSGTTGSSTSGISTAGTGADSSLTSEAESSDSSSGQMSVADKAKMSSTIFYFDFDKASLKTVNYEALKNHAAYLAQNPNAKIRVEGHADERGTREYNIALGERRGKAVHKFLSSAGADSRQMEVISYGEERPAAVGHTESAWVKNRRVELVYVAGAPR